MIKVKIFQEGSEKETVNKELVKRLYSADSEVRKDAVYQILFERRHELVGELRQAAVYEKNEEIAVLMAQTCLVLEAFPRDPSMERQIIEMIQTREGITEMSPKLWEYLANNGSSKMLIAVMGAMHETIPTNGQEFMESCLNHLDPMVRAVACTVAINSGRPTHFAYILNMITDQDQLVSETAFRVIKELPAEQMNIILDYALGSPDEWVLQNVAPFLPLLITNETRKVVAKVQYHPHPLVAKKAREALKHLNSITFVSKRLKEKHQQESKAEENPGETAKNGADEKDFASFKEQMEEKRRRRIEHERQKKEEEERLNKELEETTKDEIASFNTEMEEFKEELNDSVTPILEQDKAFIDNPDFEIEQNVLDEISEDEPEIFEIESWQADEEVIDFEAESRQVQAPEESDNEKIHARKSVVSAPSQEVSATKQIEPEVAEITSDDDIDIIVSEEDIEITVLDEHQEAEPEQKPVNSTRPPDKKPTLKPDETLILPMPAAQTILKRYPSFITDPFAAVFKSSNHQELLKRIAKVTDSLLAYLNLCFLQSCMFFVPPADMISRSIKECLKGHLTGPTALRCLHNFSLAMKQTREKPVFFTFALATLFSESSDTNPLTLLRELKEYLKAPVEPLSETIPQAVEGLTEILRTLKAIQNNLIIMKSPEGAREPYADLSGPIANILPEEKRPGIELPPGEAVVLSRDGTEAFGLYPYFKYSKRKLHFAKPGDPEFKILLERLEIDLT